MSNYYELTIDQGSTFAITVELKDYFTNDPLNLTGYTARSQIRKDYNSSTSNNFTVAIQDAANGNISMSMTASNTSNLKAGRYVYDLEIEETVSSEITRVLQGVAIVTPQVTR
jgi:hypothetical protein